MESFGGSLGYLGSKTSLTIVLRVTVAARIDLRRELPEFIFEIDAANRENSSTPVKLKLEELKNHET